MPERIVMPRVVIGQEEANFQWPPPAPPPANGPAVDPELQAALNRMGRAAAWRNIIPEAVPEDLNGPPPDALRGRAAPLDGLGALRAHTGALVAV